MLADLLQDAGYAVVEAVDGLHALEHLHAARPDLILLDLMLPGETGWDFLRARRSDPDLQRIRVLVISAAPKDRLLEAKALGADGFVSKPFDMDVLTALAQTFVPAAR